MTLPYIDTPSRWPTNKEPEERVANPSYDKQLQDHLVSEIFSAWESKDVQKTAESLKSLIQCIKSEEAENR